MSFGNTRPLVPMKVGWPRVLAESAQIIRRERRNRVAQMRRGFAVTRQEALEFIAMREVEAAAAGDQEFPSGRRHALVERHRDTGGGQDVCGHQTGRSGADNGGALVR